MRVLRVIGVIFLASCLDLGNDGGGCGDVFGSDLAIRSCPSLRDGDSCEPVGGECALDSQVTCRCTGIWRCDGADLSVRVDLSNRDR